MPWNTGVTQVDRELVSLAVPKCDGLVGNSAVSRKPPQGVAQRPRRCHHVIKQTDFAQIEFASQSEAETVILQSNRRLVQKPDLALDTQSFFRVGDHLWRQSHTLQERQRRHASAFEALDSQAGKAPSCHRD